MAVSRGVTSWSFSRWMDYQACPAKFNYKHLQKLVEPPNDAMRRGIAIHKDAEDYTRGKLKTLPPTLKKFGAEFKALKKQKVLFVEDNWAFRRDWSLTEWNNWNECWLRVKLDVAYVNLEHGVLVPIDHKTGRPRDDKNAEYELQLELYGLAGLLQQPEIPKASPRIWYLDEGVVYPNPEVREIEYTQADVPALKKKWETRVKKMFVDKTFKPTPGNACRWCHYRKSNGGPCKF